MRKKIKTFIKKLKQFKFYYKTTTNDCRRIADENSE